MESRCRKPVPPGSRKATEARHPVQSRLRESDTRTSLRRFMDIENPNPVPPRPPSPPPVPPPLVNPSPRPAPVLAPKPGRDHRGRGWKIAVLVLSILLGVSFLSNLSHTFLGALAASGGSDGRLQEAVIENNHASDKIAVIP